MQRRVSRSALDMPGAAKHIDSATVGIPIPLLRTRRTRLEKRTPYSAPPMSHLPRSCTMTGRRYDQREFELVHFCVVTTRSSESSFISGSPDEPALPMLPKIQGNNRSIGRLLMAMGPRHKANRGQHYRFRSSSVTSLSTPSSNIFTLSDLPIISNPS